MGFITDGLEIVKLLNMGANAEVHEKLGKYIEHASELQAKVEQLEEANRELTERLRIKGSLYHVHGVLFIQDDPYPLCSKCYEVSKVLVHLRLPTEDYETSGRCPNCTNYYPRADHRDKIAGPEIKFAL